MPLHHTNPSPKANAPCQLNARLSFLRPLTLWCLDTFGDDSPMLIGVQLAEDNVRFQPIELSDDDPIAALAGLVAPTDWDVVVVVADIQTVAGVPKAGVAASPKAGVVAHAVDRVGGTATEFDDDCGHRRTLHTLRGSLHSACLLLFEGPIPAA